MRLLLPALLCCAAMLTGCSFFGYYKHEKPTWAPPEEGAKVQFLNSLERGARLTGPMMAALKVAMDDYLPPSVRVEDQEYPAGKCLAQWKYINVTVFQASDDLFFVLFIPDLSNCGPGFIELDAGVEYAIDGKGRILAKQ